MSSEVVVKGPVDTPVRRVVADGVGALPVHLGYRGFLIFLKDKRGRNVWIANTFFSRHKHGIFHTWRKRTASQTRQAYKSYNQLNCVAAKGNRTKKMVSSALMLAANIAIGSNFPEVWTRSLCLLPEMVLNLGCTGSLLQILYIAGLKGFLKAQYQLQEHGTAVIILPYLKTNSLGLG